MPEVGPRAPRIYGKYRGVVVDNVDPDKVGRLKLRVPSVFGDEVTNWALPALPFGGKADQGFFFLPETDSIVWVEFEEGNPSSPLWTGVYWQSSSDVPQEGQGDPKTRLLKTPSGHLLQFDDAENSEQITLSHPKGSSLTIDPQGTVVVTDPNGGKLTLDAQNRELLLEDSNGNSVTMDASGTLVKDKSGNEIKMEAMGITVKGQKVTVEGSQVLLGDASGEPLIKGSSFLALFATHMHTCTAPGSPSSPPVPQGELSTLTTKTRAS